MSTNDKAEATDTRPTTSRWLIGFAWVVVVIPLSWGVVKSVVKSLPLFGVQAKK
jgi:hypothetical protein